MENTQNWQKTFFEKIWDVQKNRKDYPLSEAELKKIALDSGISEEEYQTTQKVFQAHLKKGDNFLKHNNWKDALQEYEEAHKINPYHATLLLQMATAYDKKFNETQNIWVGNKAISFAEATLDANPDASKAAKLITDLRKKIAFRKQFLLKRAIQLFILLLVIGLGWYFWKPIAQIISKESVVVSEFFKGKPGTTFVLKNVIFETGQTTLTENAKQELQELILFLKENPTISGEIAGHTDNTGDSAYNQQLSEQRALLVYNFLIENGVSNTQIFYKGYGASQPKKSNTSEENRAANRRIEFIIRKDGNSP